MFDLTGYWDRCQVCKELMVQGNGARRRAKGGQILLKKCLNTGHIHVTGLLFGGLVVGAKQFCLFHFGQWHVCVQVEAFCMAPVRAVCHITGKPVSLLLAPFLFDLLVFLWPPEHLASLAPVHIFFSYVWSPWQIVNWSIRTETFLRGSSWFVFLKRPQWWQLHEGGLCLHMCHLHWMAGIAVSLAGIGILDGDTHFCWTCVMELFSLQIIKVLSIWMCHIPVWFYSLVPGRSEWKFRWVISKLILMLDGWGISWKIALTWMSRDLIHAN